MNDRRIIELPCTTEDKVYYWDKGYINEAIIRWWKASYTNNTLEVNYFADNTFNHINFGLKDIGRTVFLTYEEAKNGFLTGN